MDDVSATVAATHATKKDNATASWPNTSSPADGGGGGGGSHLTIVTGGIPATGCPEGMRLAARRKLLFPRGGENLPFPNWKLARCLQIGNWRGARVRLHVVWLWNNASPVLNWDKLILEDKCTSTNLGNACLCKPPAAQINLTVKHSYIMRSQ